MFKETHVTRDTGEVLMLRERKGKPEGTFNTSSKQLLPPLHNGFNTFCFSRFHNIINIVLYNIY